MDVDPADRARYLEVYLRDHRAGADAGVRLAARCQEHAAGADIDGLEAGLARIVEDVEHDRRSLATIMAGLDIDPSTLKRLTGVAAERLGRLKLNGEVVRTSPLSVLVELEGLVGAVSMKRQLWATLRTVAGGRDEELAELVARADDQLERLRAMHARAAGGVFAASRADVA